MDALRLFHKVSCGDLFRYNSEKLHDKGRIGACAGQGLYTFFHPVRPRWGVTDSELESKGVQLFIDNKEVQLSADCSRG